MYLPTYFPSEDEAVASIGVERGVLQVPCSIAPEGSEKPGGNQQRKY